MANQEHLDIIMQGVEVWNAWREANPEIRPDLRNADLRNVDLRNADLRGMDLHAMDLNEVDLSGVKLIGANLDTINLMGANLRNADLTGADLNVANLSMANLTEANLFWTKINRTNLYRANLEQAHISYTIFTDIDLSTVTGLETVHQDGPSSIGIDTLYQSHGEIPEVFLRGCGVPDSFIDSISYLFNILQPIQYYSCFISYSTKDGDFAKRLHERMHAEHLRVWFAPEDMEGGKKIHEQIDRAIQFHDRLLLVLSEHSIQSEWVMTEIRRTRKQEIKESRRKLFPLRLTSYDTLREWTCFDADHGKDLAVEVREYFIPDFSTWKDHDAFEAAFIRLLRDLRAAEPPTSSSA